MRSNLKNNGPSTKTHEGAEAMRISSYKELRRSVLTALLWEDSFYESGESHAARLQGLVAAVDPNLVASLAIEARERMYLRHVPLYLVRELARVKGNGTLVANVLEKVIQRPDELTEYLTIYWKGQDDKEKDSLSAGSKRGLARAFAKFNSYSLAKYDRDNSVKLRDILRITHPKPSDRDKANLYKQVLDRTLPTPDTWEVELSAGKDKKATFERLLKEDKLGGLAFLRNLRNMIQSNVDTNLIKSRFKKIDGFKKVLPFRFISAAKHAPSLENYIEESMLLAAGNLPKLSGRTVLVVDTSGSMTQSLSAKSELNRLDTAAALAVLIREQCEDPAIYQTAGDDYKRIHATALVPPRRGMALMDIITTDKLKLGGGGIFLTQVLNYIYNKEKNGIIDRLIVLTDEQDCDLKLKPADANTFGKRNYLINIGSHKNGIAYGKKWDAHIDGFSERVLDFIQEIEND